MAAAIKSHVNVFESNLKSTFTFTIFNSEDAFERKHLPFYRMMKLI